MERLDLLPCFLEGTQVRQVSSHDRTGGNDDGFNGTYSYLYQDGHGEYVLFDEKVPGCIYRLWMTFSASAPLDATLLRFYFDGEETPRLVMSVADFFRGNVAPFLFPLVGNRSVSSGGYYSYYPFPYAGSLKITISQINHPFFYNITYHRFDSPEGVVTWSGTEDASMVVDMLESPGIDPKDTNGNFRVQGSTSINNGTSGTLFSMSGTGAVQSIKLDFGPLSTNLLEGVDLVMNWDGGDAEVDVPLGEFFGFKYGGIAVNSLMLGMETNGACYCYFPMPFWSSAEISLKNNNGGALAGLDFEVQYATNAYDRARSGYFNAFRHRSSFVGDGQDFNILNVEGRGQLVGISLWMHGLGNTGWYGMGYLEGDERGYVDGCRSPVIYGTGTEDYFNGGWYFEKGTFSLPCHGSPYQAHRTKNHSLDSNQTQAYRLHLADAIPFTSSLKFGIEHGSSDNDNNDANGTYASVAYYYKTADVSPGAVLTADLDSGDVWSESLYSYLPACATGAVAFAAWRFEGDDDDKVVAEEGYYDGDTNAEFTVPLVDNAGLLLRRLADQGFGGQQAAVYIDDVLAGTWYDADCNFGSTSNRWLDSEFMIGSNLVAGKTSVRISIVPLALSNTWNECHYWVYCIKPLDPVVDADHDGLPDEWEVACAGSLATLSAETDADGDGFSDLSEYIAGTQPTNAASFFSIETGPDVSFQSELGRLYDLQQCTNLTSGRWKTIKSNIPGTGHTLVLPVDTSGTMVFHRLRVDKP